MKNSIVWNNAEKKFDLFHLQPVTMNLEQGSIMGLIGENGSGKTTLIKLVLNLISLSGGNIEVLCMDSVTKQNEIKQKIAFVPDETIFYEMFTAKEVNKIISKLYVNWQENVFFDYLQKFEIPVNKNIKSFSMGMKKKLAIACALSHKAELLLLDEPMNGLDPMGIEELRELIRSFSAQGITVILSSHILSEVQLVADYVGIISSGILGYEGPFKQGQNLEELFMDVVRKNKKAGEICD